MRFFIPMLDTTTEQTSESHRTLTFADINFDDLSTFTPAMRQFLEIKHQYMSTLVLFRMGDFYETFFDDAVRANQLIGLTLTKRGKSASGASIPMAGIPMVSLDQYIARLVKLGESVVICEQSGEPGKAVTMERRIAKIVTPGTLTETALLPDKKDATLLALTAPKSRKDNYGLAYLTLSSGQFFACNASLENLLGELSRIDPSEILVPESIKTDIRALYPAVAVTSMPEWHFDAVHGREKLTKQFALDNLEAWGIEDNLSVLSSANALLDYTEETQVDAIPFIQPLKYLSQSDFVVLDASSRQNLEITQSLSHQGGPTLFSVMDHCKTTMGSRRFREWLTAPLRDLSQANERQDAIELLVNNPDFLEGLRDHLSPLPDIERIATRIAMKSVRPKELASLRDTLPELNLLAQNLSPITASFFEDIKEALAIDTALFDLLKKSLLEEPATFLRDGDVMSNAVSEELCQLRELRDHVGEFLAQMEIEEKEKSGISTLRIEFNRVHGFFIEVSKGQSDNVPEHYQRRQTLKNCERYTTPELKSYEEKALSAKERSQALEKALYDALLDSLQLYVASLLSAASAIASLDTLAALAEHAHQYHWVKPTLTKQASIEIVQGRHPVVETVLEHYIPNDCMLMPGRRCLIITGPNMGGKSTYMRSIALITLLAWMGSFVPAKAARIGAIDRIHTRIGASDDLARGRSTFMVEMTEAAAILHQATDQSLVLMDEIGRGTSTFDGLSLAGAIAQELAEKTRAFTLFATHYFELTALAAQLKEVANIHVSAEQSKNRIVFLHQISEGPANQSYGIAVAQLAGIPGPVVRRAKTLLAELEKEKNHTNSPQDDLFSVLSQSEESALTLDAQKGLKLLDALQGVNVDELSPREALSILYELKEKTH